MTDLPIPVDPICLPDLRPRARGPSRRPFSREEDSLLLQLVEQHGRQSWNSIASFMQSRTSRQCRDRYNNYLDESRSSLDQWTAAEDEMIRSRYQEVGPKWAEIARCLNGRKGNDVKEHWYSHLAKALEEKGRKIKGTADCDDGKGEQLEKADGAMELDPGLVEALIKAFLDPNEMVKS
jgi:hypothetical protein